MRIVVAGCFLCAYVRELENFLKIVRSQERALWVCHHHRHPAINYRGTRRRRLHADGSLVAVGERAVVCFLETANQVAIAATHYNARFCCGKNGRKRAALPSIPNISTS